MAPVDIVVPSDGTTCLDGHRQPQDSPKLPNLQEVASPDLLRDAETSETRDIGQWPAGKCQPGDSLQKRTLSSKDLGQNTGDVCTGSWKRVSSSKRVAAPFQASAIISLHWQLVFCKMNTTPPTRPALTVEARLAPTSSNNRQGGPGLAPFDEAPFPSVELPVMQAGSS